MSNRRVIEKVLKENTVELIAGLNCKSGLLEHLVAQEPRILTAEEKERTLSKPTRMAQNDELVSILMAKDDTALDSLYDYLKNNGYAMLAIRLGKSAAGHGHMFSDNHTTKVTTKQSTESQDKPSAATSSSFSRENEANETNEVMESSSSLEEDDEHNF